MEWLKGKIKEGMPKLREALRELAPSLLPVADALEAGSVSEAIAARIRAEAKERAEAILRAAHEKTIQSIIWQNALLLGSLPMVWALGSAIPFYMAYACVFGYSSWELWGSKDLILGWARKRSLTGVIQEEVRAAIDKDLRDRRFYERKIVEYLGPDLDAVAAEIAGKLRKDVVRGLANMALTVFVSFVAFRLFAIPMLEHMALSAGS